MTRSFVASVATVAGGTAVAQAISLASLPFITRLYAPSDYGSFVVFTAWGGLLGAVACARFEVAIPLPRTARAASSVALGSLAVGFSVAALSAVAVALVWLADRAWLPPVLWWLPLHVALAAALAVFGNWTARVRGFARLSASRILQAALTGLLSIGLGWHVGGAGWPLVVATLAGQLAGALVLMGGLGGNGFVAAVRPRRIRRLLRHFRRLALFNVPHVLSDAAQASGLPLAVAALFGPQAAAYYAFASRLLKAPLGLVSSAIAQVYYPRAAEHRNDTPKLRRDALRILMFSAPGAALALPVLLLIPDALYAAVFGARWGQLGEVLRALSPWVLSSFVAAPLSVLYLVKERFGLDFALGLAGTVTLFSTLGVAMALGAGFAATLWTISIAMTVYVVATTIAEFRIVIGRHDAAA